MRVLDSFAALAASWRTFTPQQRIGKQPVKRSERLFFLFPRVLVIMGGARKRKE